MNVLNNGVSKKLDVGVLAGTVQHDFGRAKLITTVDQCDFTGKAREK